MNTLSTFTEPLGWALLHFLWQGAAITLLLRVFLWLARRSAPQVRYAAAGAALLLMLGAVVGTVSWQTQRNRTEVTNGPQRTQVTLTVPSMLEAPQESHPSREAHVAHPPIDAPNSAAAIPLPAPAPQAQTAAAAERLRALLPWLVGAWAAGVALFSLRLVNGWRSVRRWRLSGNDSISAEWRIRFSALCDKLRLSRPVRLLSSASLAVPVVIGWIKPAVLVPAGLFSGIPAAQLEAILAHELAHVRRCDWLVNLLQTVVETVLFYHPAVWWVSAQLRKEREHCCDDIAASLHGDTIAYARALTALEELRAVPAGALSAAGGSLLQRIRRLAGLPEERAGGMAWPLGILTAAALALALVFALPRQAGAQQRDAAVPAAGETGVLDTNAGGKSPVEAARGVGQYDLADRVKLQVTQVTSSEDGKGTSGINTATIEWYAGNGQLGLSWPIELTPGPELDPIIWRRGGNTLWIVHDKGVRKLDFSNAADVKEKVFQWQEGADFEAPVEVREEILKAVAGRVEQLEPLRIHEELQEEGALIIVLAADEAISIAGEKLTMDELKAKVAAIAKDHPNRTVIIRADRQTKFSAVSDLTKVVGESGLQRIGFGVTGTGRRIAPADSSPSVPPDDPKDKPAVGTAGPGISLTVLDAAGKTPLKEFRVIAGVRAGSAGGKDTINWQPHTLRAGKNGGLVWPLDKAYDEMALRVEADGYAPQVFNWIEKKKGPQDLFFQMVEGGAALCQVWTPDRKPASGAVVALAMVQRDAVIDDGKLRHFDAVPAEKPSDQWRRPRILKANETGQAVIPAETDPTAALLVLHESGVREISLAEFRKQIPPPDVNRDGLNTVIQLDQITLQPWARVTGNVQWADKPGAGQKVSLTIHRDSYGYPGIIAQYEKTTAAADGSFVFEKVLPGPVQLSCPIAAGADNAAGFTEINLTGRIAHTELKPGDNRVVIGGVGTAIKGRLTGRENWDGVTFHFHPTAPHIGFPGDEEIWKAFGEFQKSPEGALYFRNGLKVNADGTFEVAGVMPGDYQIFFKREGEDKYLASGKFTMKPETVQREPMDIGEFRAAP